jgi:hypothetical protein
MGTNMAPHRKVINHGATNMQRTAAGGLTSAVPAIRTCTAPSLAIDTSIRSADVRRASRVAKIAPTAAASAAPQTLAGCRGSDQSAAAISVKATVAAVATAVSRSRRSRADGCRTVQPRITQSRLKTRVPFVPPKPNEFFRATSIVMSRAVLAQ